jgi:hypothetical protein
MDHLQSASEMSDVERNSLLLDISSVPTPTQHLIEKLKLMILEADETTTLLLIYGALASNAAPEDEVKMVNFLCSQIPKHTTNNTEVLIHVLRALGNTNSTLAINCILQYTQHENDGVKETSVTALRFFVYMSAVQQQFIGMVEGSDSEALISAIIDTLEEGYKSNPKTILNQRLLESLTNVTITVGDADLQIKMGNFLKMLDTPDALMLVEGLESSIVLGHIQKRQANYWTNSNPMYSKLCSVSERRRDVSNFPNYRSYLWYHTVGKAYGSYQIYVRGVAGAFAGTNSNCDVKISAKCLFYFHIFGYERDILRITGNYEQAYAKLYVRYGSRDLLDINYNASFSYSRSYFLPSYRKEILSLSYPFSVFGVPLSLGIDVWVQVGGSLSLSASNTRTGRLQASATLTPYAKGYVDASLSVSIFIARVGIALTGSATYEIGADLSATVCNTQFSVYDEWPGTHITLSAFYQRRRVWGGWKSRRSWDIFDYQRSSSSGRRYLYRYG